MNIKVAVCNRRTNKRYKNIEMEWDAIKARNKNPVRTWETAEEYPRLAKSQRDDIKDVGGLVGGWLTGGIRKNGQVTFRTLGLLDADCIAETEDFIGKIKTELPGVELFIYSTHSHNPKHQRYRVVMPFSREVSEDEYPAVMRMVAKQIGMDYFDDSTYEANRMMYWASCSSNGVFVFEEQSGKLLNPDAYLSRYADWRDVTQWPTSSRESEAVRREITEVENPLEKQNIVGAFCRAYPNIREAIEKFLPKVYTPSAYDGRYDYIPGESSAGVVIYDDIFVYSHHATDPASAKLLNAFDLVRIHRFGDDEKSFQQMAQFASKDDKVKALLFKEKAEEANLDFDDDWHKELERDRTGLLKNTLRNLLIILSHDPKLKGIVFNQLADGMEIKGELPWQHPAKFWRDQDDAQLISYIDLNYGTFSQRNYLTAVTKIADDRSYHPIKEYLESLPPWDGEVRAETLPIVYLGAEDNAYVRAVTRKSLCAAVYRVYNPGMKFDSMPVWIGPQGIGKSTLIAKLGGEWYSDSLQISDMNDKTAAEKLQGFWILEIGELAGMRKADVDKVKAFISRQDDKYRASFGRRVTPHPRQNILIGTTNNESGFLRDITGNRRFWVIHTPGTGIKKPWNITTEEVSQIWAEILVMVKAGETLYLDSALEQFAQNAQREAMETDDREGLVRAYLAMLLPEDWDSYDLHRRLDYINYPDDPLHVSGTWKRSMVSNMEIWCECFGRKKEDLRPQDSYAIGAIMAKINGWERSDKLEYLPIYGRQRVYKWNV